MSHFWSMSNEALIHYAFLSAEKAKWYRELVWEFLRENVE